MQSSRLKFVALWQLTGMVCSLGLGAMLVFIENLTSGLGVATGLYRLPFDLVWLFSGVVLIAPLSLVVLGFWVRACAKFPVLESSPMTTVFNLVLVAAALAVLAGAISSWEASVETFFSETLSVARAVIVWAVVGVVLPRILVRALRPGRIT